MLEINLNPTTENVISDLNQVYDFAIIGGGPAGLNAALYAYRKGLKVVVVSPSLGGQLLNTNIIDNVLGFNEISGQELTNKYLSHLDFEAITHLYQMAKGLKKDETKNVFEITLDDDKIITAKSVLLAMGALPRKLGVTGEQEFTNRGLTYCAICDGPLFKGKDIAIIGGGNSAIEAVIDLSKIVRHITLIHRSQFRADAWLLNKFKDLPNVTVLMPARVEKIKGENLLSSIEVLDLNTNQISEINVNGMFIEIGVIPNTELVKDLVKVNDSNEIIVDEKQMTSIPGLFAAGDITEQKFKQITISLAEGAKAALYANEYLTKGE